VSNCRIFQNSSATDGGGVKTFNTNGTVHLVNNTFVNNSGGAVAATNNGGVYNTPTVINVVNCICWNNGKEFSVTGTSTVSKPAINVSYSDLSIGTTGGSGVNLGTGNINADPKLTNPLAWTLHLQSTSPCINKGSNAAPGLPAKDMDNMPRVVGGTVDMGADEFDKNSVLLYHDRGQISIANPGTALFTIDAGSSRAGLNYLIVPGISGVYPGLQLGALFLPMNLDFLWPLGQVFPGFRGVLDAAGRGKGTFNMSSGRGNTSVIGVELYFCSTVLQNNFFVQFSNNTSLEFIQ
jgi:hypothetical protein